MLTVLSVVQKTTEFFASKGVENARLNAELLVGHALGLKRMQLYLQFERPLSEPELEKIRPLVRRRAQHEPLQYILGEVEWSGLKLKVDRRALIPRPETELLVELITTAIGATPQRILDLGTGTGAIALALATKYPDAKVLATDRSEDALQLARENAAVLELSEKVELKRSHWFNDIPDGETFDLVVSNPPYLSDEEVAQAAAEVRDFEPRSALVAEDSGAADLCEIIRTARPRLSAGGLLALETGIAQHERLLRSCSESGYTRTESHKDLTGRDRFVFAWA